MHAFSPAQLSLLKIGARECGSLDSARLFILRNGWAAATTRQYAAAVNKFISYLEVSSNPAKTIPFSRKTVYQFMLWCSTSSNRRVSSTTIRRYLTGLRMWHVLHDVPFPMIDLNRVRLLLKSCKITETAPVKKLRVGLTLQDVVNLTDKLSTDNAQDLVTKAIILTGFWSLARLGELTGHRDHPTVFVRRRDLTFSHDGMSAHIRLRLAKTASPGEIQLLRMRCQPNRLDPINALQELLKRVPGTPNDPLFPSRIRTVPMENSRVETFLKSYGPQDNSKWGGHSLRIGGASFQRACGRPVSSLKRLGRWKSLVYKSYIHRYLPALKKATCELAEYLHF